MGDTFSGKEETPLPWQETSPVKERMQFIREHQRGEESVASLCRRFGISRKTGYKWLHRYYSDGGSADHLVNRSRRPRTHLNRTLPPLEEASVAVRGDRPHLGPRELRGWLARHEPAVALVAVRTFAIARAPRSRFHIRFVQDPRESPVQVE